MTIREFIAKHGITMQAVQIPARDDIDDTEWGWTASHWNTTFFVGGKGITGPLMGQFTTGYSMGSAHAGQPKSWDVLSSLAMDSRGVANTFEEWAGDYGYDTDSRKAERIYKACQEIAAKLRKALGNEAYRELLSCEQE